MIGIISALNEELMEIIDKIETERWHKWMVGDQVNLTVEQILADHKLSLDILDISGHYAFNDDLYTWISDGTADTLVKFFDN